MKLISKTIIFMLLFLMLVVQITHAENITNDPQENLTALFALGLELKELDSIKQNPYVIEARGNIQIVESEFEERLLIDSYRKIATNASDDIAMYFYPNGPVISHGALFKGYLFVDFLEGSEKTIH